MAINVADLLTQCCQVEQCLRIQPFKKRCQLLTKILVMRGDVGISSQVRRWVIGTPLFKIIIALVPELKLLDIQ